MDYHLPNIGDVISFDDDSLTDKGPASGSVLKVDKNKHRVVHSISDTVFDTDWKKFMSNISFRKNMRDDKPVWNISGGKQKAYDAITDLNISHERWNEENSITEMKEGFRSLRRMILEDVSEIFVHVDDGRDYGDEPNDEDIGHVMQSAQQTNGVFDGESDKGAVFKFQTDIDADNFIRRVSDSPNGTVFADRIDG